MIAARRSNSTSSALTGVDCELSETASTGISYPRFLEDLQSVREYG